MFCALFWRGERNFAMFVTLLLGRNSDWLDGPGIESQWGEVFRTHLVRPWGPPSLLYNRYRVIPGGKATGAWR